MKKGFTLLELLIVIGILAILATTVTVVLNPAELLRQARDSQRLGDLRSVHAALGMFAATATTTPLFTATTTCTAINALTPFNGIACVYNNSTKVIGIGAQATSTGWVNVNFALVSGGSPLSRLPMDPVNDTTSYYGFKNDPNNNTWELNANLESGKYSNEETRDGGDNDNFYEIGTVLTLGSLECPNNVQDADGNIYNTVIINNQCWMKENLRRGTRIAGSINQTDGGNDGVVEKYCYNDLDANCVTYGGLYQWDEAMNYSVTEGAQGICPAGWHIPTDAEQYNLENYLKDIGQTCIAARSGPDCATAGDKLKSGGSSGFNALLAGYRNTSSPWFNFLNMGTYFWSSSQGGLGAWSRVLASANTVSRNSYTKAPGFSVRCLKY